MEKDIIILGIESSCDDTSAAVIKNGWLLSNVTSSQDVHRTYGGVVPEIEDGVTEIVENGIRYKVDFANGQKTGFFLDQKYNRQAVAKLVKGRKVLDCFTHTGSFALNAIKGGAERVTAVDISADALKMAKENAKLNGWQLETIEANVFDLLTKMSLMKIYISGHQKNSRRIMTFILMHFD